MGDIAGSRSGRFRPLPDVWMYAVEAATSEREVVVSARDYLATWTPQMISRLPEDCRPGRITSGEDISEFAFRLSQAQLSDDRCIPDRLLLERMAAFFSHAAAQIARILRATVVGLQ